MWNALWDELTRCRFPSSRLFCSRRSRLLFSLCLLAHVSVQAEDPAFASPSLYFSIYQGSFAAIFFSLCHSLPSEFSILNWALTQQLIWFLLCHQNPSIASLPLILTDLGCSRLASRLYLEVWTLWQAFSFKKFKLKALGSGGREELCPHALSNPVWLRQGTVLSRAVHHSHQPLKGCGSFPHFTKNDVISAPLNFQALIHDPPIPPGGRESGPRNLTLYLIIIVQIPVPSTYRPSTSDSQESHTSKTEFSTSNF